jgi:hypothetical protein
MLLCTIKYSANTEQCFIYFSVKFYSSRRYIFARSVLHGETSEIEKYVQEKEKHFLVILDRWRWDASRNIRNECDLTVVRFYLLLSQRWWIERWISVQRSRPNRDGWNLFTFLLPQVTRPTKNLFRSRSVGKLVEPRIIQVGSGIGDQEIWISRGVQPWLPE